MDKNKDLLFADLSKAMFACERSLLKELFPEGTFSFSGGGQHLFVSLVEKCCIN